MALLAFILIFKITFFFSGRSPDVQINKNSKYVRTLQSEYWILTRVGLGVENWYLPRIDWISSIPLTGKTIRYLIPNLWVVLVHCTEAFALWLEGHKLIHSCWSLSSRILNCPVPPSTKESQCWSQAWINAKIYVSNVSNIQTYAKSVRGRKEAREHFLTTIKNTFRYSVGAPFGYIVVFQKWFSPLWCWCMVYAQL